MTSTLKKKLSIIVASLALALVPLLAVSTAHAQVNINENLNQGACLSTDTSADCPTGDEAEGQVNSIIEDVINFFSLIVGVVSVIMIIIGGFKYITSGGESAGTQGAKNTILFAIVGLVVVALAQIIVRFVLNRVTTT
ncbi:MAG: pilin [bacterium]|nr:pilin [bacterium]